MWFHGDSFVELCKSIVDLVEHHHAITSVCIVLSIFLVEADSCSKIIHSFLIMSNCHECLSSFTVVFGMC